MKISHFYQLVFVKVRLNLRSETSKTYLNYIWWILEPALFVAVFYLVFGVFLNHGGPGFVAFLVCGQIPFLWFSRSVLNSSGSILDGRQLLSQVYIPKLFFPLVIILQDLVKQGFVFILLLVFLVVYGIPVTSTWLYLPLVAVTQFVFILAVGLVAAAIVPMVPDFRYIISTGMVLLMFGSGVFYNYKVFVETEHQALFLSNPMAALIEAYRQVLLEGTSPNLAMLGIIALVSIGAIVLVSRVLRNYNGAYARLALQ